MAALELVSQTFDTGVPIVLESNASELIVVEALKYLKSSRLQNFMTLRI